MDDTEKIIQYSIDNKLCYPLHKLDGVYNIKNYICERYNFKINHIKTITIEKFIKAFFNTAVLDTPVLDTNILVKDKLDTSVFDN